MSGQSELFNVPLEENKDPVDNTEITSTILYYSKEEMKEFKTLSKNLMKGIEEKNISDLMLRLLRYATDNG